MKKVLILVDSIGPKKQKLADYLGKTLSNTRVSISSIKNTRVEIFNGECKIFVDDKDLASYDLVYFRRAGDYLNFAGDCAYYLHKRGVKFFDQRLLNLGTEGKIGMLIKLSLNGVTVPDTIYFADGDKRNNFNYVKNKFGFPFVAKDMFAQRMLGVFIVKSENDIQGIINENEARDFYFQGFIEHKLEYRVLVLGKEVGVLQQKVERFLTKGSHLTMDDTLPDIFLDKAEIRPEIKKAAIDASRVMDVQVSGVDVIWDEKNNKAWVIEVNRGPGLVPDEKTSPELLAISKYFEKCLK